ncbi:Gti1/Pac2 family-domain-containing protein [Schizophyllum fasciatum]
MSSQPPTCTNLRVRTPEDARVIFHAVALNILPLVTRRLDNEERRSIASGSVYVWEERQSGHAYADSHGLGIERWTDSVRWGPSRVRDEFLFYHEKDDQHDGDAAGRDADTKPRRPREPLVKQTYSVFINMGHGLKRKQHLIAYFTQSTVNSLQTIDDIPVLANLPVPIGLYVGARVGKGRKDSNAHASHSNYPWQTTTQPYYENWTQPYLTPAPAPYHPPATDEDRGSRNAAVHLPMANEKKDLAPLVYLQNAPPARRHPVDETALMALTPMFSAWVM